MSIRLNRANRAAQPDRANRAAQSDRANRAATQSDRANKP
ncbi:MAG: hypothetical protein QOF30_1048, partial [Acidimicrobiaceae bacterium]|nr:hypothetical protein [Acidimicrobiaceae bacterium]